MALAQSILLSLVDHPITKLWTLRIFGRNITVDPMLLELHQLIKKLIPGRVRYQLTIRNPLEWKKIQLHHTLISSVRTSCHSSTAYFVFYGFTPRNRSFGIHYIVEEHYSVPNREGGMLSTRFIRSWVVSNELALIALHWKIINLIQLL